MLDFIIIGAAKSGTSWLANNLGKNPSFFVPPAEIHYFSRYYERKSIEWYSGFFADRQPGQVAGERSNTYMTDPRAPARIFRELPNVKLLAILRNPVERAYSGYCMRLDRGLVSADINRELDPANARAREILENGLYTQQLGRFLERFPRERVHIAIHDDISARPIELLSDISKFLAAPHTFDSASVKFRYNARKSHGIKPVYNKLLGAFMRSERWRRGVGKSLRSSPLGRTLLRAVSSSLTYPPFDDGIRTRLAAFYADEVELLSDFTGRNLDNWLNNEKPSR